MANILVADDDEQYPIMLEKILRNDNHTVFIAKDGAEALKLCESQKFDLIITDIFMPNVDGIGLITDLIERNSKVPIIAISGGGNMISAELNLQFADAVGAYSVLKKPFTNEQFLESVKNALESTVK
jgi:DNA-binding NtrC family response regulator